MPKPTCNNCTNRNCRIWERNMEGKLRYPLKASALVKAEQLNLLTCHLPDDPRKWKFTDLVSRVKITNPNNPAIALIAGT